MSAEFAIAQNSLFRRAISGLMNVYLDENTGLKKTFTLEARIKSSSKRVPREQFPSP
jgi:hypothetical protein